MLHKCLSVAFADIFTNFGEIVSGPVALLGSVFLNRALISATAALGKSKVIEETKLFFLSFSILECLPYFVMIPSVIS